MPYDEYEEILLDEATLGEISREVLHRLAWLFKTLRVKWWVWRLGSEGRRRLRQDWIDTFEKQNPDYILWNPKASDFLGPGK